MKKITKLSIFKTIFFGKKIWKKPRQKKILIFDYVSSYWLLKYINSEQIEYYYPFGRGTMNMYVISKMLLSGNLSSYNYKKIYLSCVNPSFIITLIDNNPSFYKLKELCPEAKTIFIQNGHRMSLTDIFSHKLKKQNYYVDHMFVFNPFVAKIYQKFLEGNFHFIGSFYSNQHIIKKKENIDFLYVSSYRPDLFEIRKSFTKNCSWNFFYSREKKLLLNIGKYLKKNNKIMHILGAARDQKINPGAEIEFYKKFILPENMKFIKRYKNRNNYKIIDSSKIVISTTSTVGYESYGRGKKTAFFSARPKTIFFNSSKFGWPAKIKDKGLFWSDSNELKEVERVLNNLLNISNSDWKKYKTGCLKNLMTHDKNNGMFLKIMKKINFPLKSNSR